MKLRIACVQLNPVIGSLKETTERALQLLETAFPSRQPHIETPDLIIFPELALTGYNFPNRTAISPYLEHQRTGHSSQFAAMLSKKYGCYTVVGYPEVDNNDIIYNSAIVSSPLGQFVHNYRKSFLYETDEAWGCVEGPGFDTFALKFGNRSVNAAIGICMDLNPYKFEAPFYNFEFATHCLERGVELVLCPMAWLWHDSPSIKNYGNEEKKNVVADLQQAFETQVKNYEYNTTTQDNIKANINPLTENKNTLDLTLPDKSNLNYWILRFFPFLNYANFTQHPDHKPTVVVCNRSGLEDDVMYAGSSSIFKFNNRQSQLQYHDSRNDSVEYLGYLGAGTEGVLVRDVEV